MVLRFQATIFLPFTSIGIPTMTQLQLDRPLAFFDIESTGTNPKVDRIIDLAVVILDPGGTEREAQFLMDPGVPIPPESTRIHGITDADVAGKPTFPEEAGEIAAFLEGCDLAGYNVIRFDVPMLLAEFGRAGLAFSMEGRRLVDAQRVFHQKEPRDLTAAVRFYCGTEREGAHEAMADVRATMQVLEGQLTKYPDLAGTVEALHAFCNQRHPDWADREGRLRWTHGEVAINFGKNAGRTLRSLVDEGQRGFLNWIIQNDFPEDTKRIVSEALEGNYPPPPGPPRDSGQAGE